MSSLPTRGDSRQHLIQLLESLGSSSGANLTELLSSDTISFAALVRLLTQLDYEESVAREHFRAILKHREALTRSLGHEATIQLAALDYFQRVLTELRNPKLIEMATFLETERSAITDGLTSLYNRQFFDVSLRRELKRSRRYGLAFSLVMLDLDDFKAINDLYGHPVGDEALTVCSNVILESVREIDVACRYGGEEFALILPETSRTGAYIVSERIRADVHDIFHHRPLGNAHVSLSVSGGIALYPADSNSAEGLVRMADRALYRSKHEGKNKITLHAEEKRRSPRLDARNLLVFRERRPEQRELQSRTRNLSRNGALVDSEIPINVGTELEIDIHLPQEKGNVFLKGRVVRLEEASEQNTGYHVGVAFVADTDEDARKLEDFASEIYRPIEQQPPRPDVDRTG
jgi:diguanylate cyclase (GGDEF)-like protein